MIVAFTRCLASQAFSRPLFVVYQLRVHMSPRGTTLQTKQKDLSPYLIYELVMRPLHCVSHIFIFYLGGHRSKAVDQ